MKSLHPRPNISFLITKTESYLKSNEDVLFSYLFGSASTNKMHPKSDLDIAVYLTRGNLNNKKMHIIGDLIDLLKYDNIDLVVLNTAPLPLKARIVKTRRLMSDRAPFTRHAFESATIRTYLDFSKIESRILERRYFHGR